jgi:hypothetical protein
MKARENPFRTEKVLQARFRLETIETDLSLEKLVRRWEKLGRRGAIIGPHGHGKTTLLEDLAELFQKQDEKTLFLRLAREKRRFSGAEWQQIQTASPDTILLCDGVEQLNRLNWARFKHISKRTCGVIITSHHAGMLPTLLECRTSPQLLSDIVKQILGTEAAQLGIDCEALWQRHQGDVRLALRELYDCYAAKTLPHSHYV